MYELFYQALLNILQNIKKALTGRQRIIVCVILKREQSQIEICKHFFFHQNSIKRIIKF